MFITKFSPTTGFELLTTGPEATFCQLRQNPGKVFFDLILDTSWSNVAGAKFVARPKVSRQERCQKCKIESEKDDYDDYDADDASGNHFSH